MIGQGIMHDVRVRLPNALLLLILMIAFSSGCNTQQNVSQNAMRSLLQSLKEATEAKNRDKIFELLSELSRND